MTGVGFDIAVVAVVSALAIALHVVLFVMIRRWMDRDLALSFAGDDAGKRSYMLECLRRAKREGINRRELPRWLGCEAMGYGVQEGS